MREKRLESVLGMEDPLRINVSDTPENIKRGLSEQEELFKYLSGGADFFFRYDRIPNAFASKFGKNYSIAINIGMVETLAALSYALMADPKNLPQIGTVSGEDVSPDQLDELNKNFRKPGYGFKVPSYPKDARRFEAAQRFASGAILFIFCHELAHVFNGHLAYLTSTSENVFVHDELGVHTPRGSREMAFTLRALELDADICGTINGLTFWENLYKIYDYGRDLGAIGPIESWQVSIELASWALILLQEPRANYEGSSHPAPAVRMINLNTIDLFFSRSRNEKFQSGITGWVASHFLVPKFGKKQVASLFLPEYIDREIKDLRAKYESLTPDLLLAVGTLELAHPMEMISPTKFPLG